ncbi:NADH-quinone oxidoreductase subunit C, partial [Kitasatospora sp. NPDC059599]
RTPRAAAAAAGGAAGAAAEGAPVRADRPRRTRSVAEGSASQPAPGAEPAEVAPAEGEPAPEATPAVRTDRPRRTRSVSAGSVSQTADEPGPERPAPARPASSDAPWHNPVPAHDAKPTGEAPAEPAGDGPAEPTGEAPAEPTDRPEQKDDTAAAPADRDGDGA